MPLPKLVLTGRAWTTAADFFILWMLFGSWGSRGQVPWHRAQPFLFASPQALQRATSCRSTTMSQCNRKSFAWWRPTTPFCCTQTRSTLAANLLPSAVYIPSESNPADAPSRGKRNKPTSSRPCRKVGIKGLFGKRRGAVLSHFCQESCDR